jgi:hypothetical protein
MTQRGRRNQDQVATHSTAASSLLFAAVDDDENDTMSSLSIPDDSHSPTVPRSTSTHSPYLHPTHQATASTSTFNVGGQLASASGANTPTMGHAPVGTLPGTPRAPASRKPSSLRHTSGPAESLPPSIKRRPSSPSAKEGKYSSSKSATRPRATPRLPHSDDPPAPATAMYWSRAPVHGHLPMRSFRAHTVTLVDHVAWLFGGCDDKGCWRDVYCFDTGELSFFGYISFTGC